MAQLSIKIIEVNELNENCGETYRGQDLFVPLTKARLLISMSDLNCDRNSERVHLIPNPNDPTLDTVLGVVLVTTSEISLFHETWQFTIAEEQMRLITRPYRLGEDTCKPMISFTGTPSTRDTNEHRLYF